MKREVIRVEPMSSWLAKRNAPVSPVTRGGGIVFVSGLPPFDPDTGELFAGPIERQTELVLDQLKSHMKRRAGLLPDEPPPWPCCRSGPRPAAHEDREV